MPDLGALLVLLALTAVAAAAVAAPLLRRAPTDADLAPREELEYLHRAALDALRDVEADRRAGSLDEADYRRERSAAQARATETLAALEAAPPSAGDGSAAVAWPRRAALAIGAALAILLVAGSALPSHVPVSLAQPIRVNQALADAQAAEEARQATIAQMLERFRADPNDAEALAALGRAYLAGGPDELARAATVLVLLISLEPENAEAHVDLATAFVRAGSLEDATTTVDRLEELAPGSPDIPFLRGLIARQAGRHADAVEQFDRFLGLAPDDPRAPMIRGLRAESAALAPGA